MENSALWASDGFNIQEIASVTPESPNFEMSPTSMFPPEGYASHWATLHQSCEEDERPETSQTAPNSSDINGFMLEGGFKPNEADSEEHTEIDGISRLGGKLGQGDQQSCKNSPAVSPSSTSLPYSWPADEKMSPTSTLRVEENADFRQSSNVSSFMPLENFQKSLAGRRLAKSLLEGSGNQNEDVNSAHLTLWKLQKMQNETRFANGEFRHTGMSHKGMEMTGWDIQKLLDRGIISLPSRRNCCEMQENTETETGNSDCSDSVGQPGSPQKSCDEQETSLFIRTNGHRQMQLAGSRQEAVCIDHTKELRSLQPRTGPPQFPSGGVKENFLSDSLWTGNYPESPQCSGGAQIQRIPSNPRLKVQCRAQGMEMRTVPKRRAYGRRISERVDGCASPHHTAGPVVQYHNCSGMESPQKSDDDESFQAANCSHQKADHVAGPIFQSGDVPSSPECRGKKRNWSFASPLGGQGKELNLKASDSFQSGNDSVDHQKGAATRERHMRNKDSTLDSFGMLIRGRKEEGVDDYIGKYKPLQDWHVDLKHMETSEAENTESFEIDNLAEDSEPKTGAAVKISHIKPRSMVERKRRERISKQLTRLRNVIPRALAQGKDTAGMLDGAVDYILLLERQVAKLEAGLN